MSEKAQATAEVSLVLPVHNEAQSIETVITEFYEEIGKKIPLEIVVAEDGSTDGTKEVLLLLSQKIPMKLSLGDHRRGYLGGAKEGLRNVGTEFVFFVDSDGQHVASDFWKLYEKRFDYDMIVGRKIKRTDPFYRIVISEVFHRLIRIVFRLPIHQPDTGYRLMNKTIIDSVLEETRFLTYSSWSEFTVRAYKKGFKLAEVPVTHRARLHGPTTQFTPFNLLRIVPVQLKGIWLLWRDLRRK
ncbi:MAG: glycosyltransferase family 2 protein [Chloroflexi bacterium]|nr:glycosyltransferase family 2 protein [Chloroflexota bacterium]